MQIDYTDNMYRDILEFHEGPHAFRIGSNESCMVRTLSLFVHATLSTERKATWIDIYCITEGDHIWSTLVANNFDEKRNYDLSQAIDHLRNYVPVFVAEHPGELHFATNKQVDRFTRRHASAPVRFREASYPFPEKYPGS